MLLDLLSSLAGLLTWNKKSNFHDINDIYYAFKILRFFTLIRLLDQIKSGTSFLSHHFKRTHPNLVNLIPLMGIISSFLYVLHVLAFLLSWLAINRLDSGDSWYFNEDYETHDALYVSSFYFGCTTLTTIGYGDYKPFSSG